MKVRVGIIALALAVATASVAAGQVATGNITGTVLDEQGAVLPGVLVTLTGADRTATFTTDVDGRYRFMALPPGMYRIQAELPGFATIVREQVEVRVGQFVELPVQMRVAAVLETVTVIGESPLVDQRQMGTSTNFTQDELMRVPNSRDPWALLRTVPGVTMDRVNIAGNETGQQSEFMGKGTRRFDATWTYDGVVITDMAATGASPTYFDYDAFDEIQISTGGHDIRQPSPGVGLNFVVKRGTNAWRGTARGYFTNNSLESSNVPAELQQRGITADTTDHNDQISDFGFDVAGPIIRDRAWFYAGWTEQDIRLIRQAGGVLDRTILRTTNIKGTVQAAESHVLSVLWFNGVKEKEGRATGQAQFEPLSARWNQGGNYPDGRPRGLLKFQDDWVVTPNNFLSLKYAYYGTGFSLSPIGGLDQQAGISAFQGRTFGSTQEALYLRPQHILNADTSSFYTGWLGRHELQYGLGFRRHDSGFTGRWPGDMTVAYQHSATDTRARLNREAQSTNRTEYFNIYVADRIMRDRTTIELGVRYDRQWGSALEANTQSNIAFPNIVPGIQFAGYRAPFTWNTFSPRVGLTYALDQARNTLLRASYSRYAGQLDSSIVGYMNPSGLIGWVEFPWTDLNGDNLAQPNEVNINAAPLAFGGGFNPAAPTAVTSANQIDPNLEPMRTDNIVLGFDREVRRNLAAQVAYTFTRQRNHADTFTPWLGVGANDYLPGAVLTGSLPDGTPYNVQTFIPDPAAVAAGGRGRLMTNYPGYSSRYHGVELSMVKRLADRWMGRLAFSVNNPTEHYDVARTSLGNPTPLDTFPLQSGGQYTQRSFGSGAGDVFMNARWQFNANGVYQLPWWNLEAAGNLFGRQGNPHPIWHSASLGLDGTQRVLVSPTVDHFRYDNLWNVDLRLAHNLRAGRATGQITADLFNVFNANTELQRERHILSPNFNRLNQNLSPRILRIGVRLGF
jgi:hypothetical protein